jgi:hypothetical protein
MCHIISPKLPHPHKSSPHHLNNHALSPTSPATQPSQNSQTINKNTPKNPTIATIPPFPSSPINLSLSAPAVTCAGLVPFVALAVAFPFTVTVPTRVVDVLVEVLVEVYEALAGAVVAVVGVEGEEVEEEDCSMER